MRLWLPSALFLPSLALVVGAAACDPGTGSAGRKLVVGVDGGVGGDPSGPGPDGGAGGAPFLGTGGAGGGQGDACVSNCDGATVCGDGAVGPGEQCDDGDVDPLDGCDDACLVEPGFTCPSPGHPCERIEYCGDGVVSVDLAEQCDDAAAVVGDGCDGTCQLEANFVCPTPGAPCVSTVRCGDGKLAGAEQCDDHDTRDGDGCSAACLVEAGWVCPSVGARCVARACGDGVVAGSEQCDDGSSSPAPDGCTTACKLEPGFACAGTTPTVCHATVCGDGNREGFEQCDDGNRIPYDDCSPTCTVDPSCAGGQCSAVCGDGFKFPQEACDDGNTADGDGCSAACVGERGFLCQDIQQSPPSSIQIPILYRDFLYAGTTTPGRGHPDFEAFGGPEQLGIVQNALGADGKPVFAATMGRVTSADSFYTWYHDTWNGGPNPYARLVYLDLAGNPTTLTLGAIAGGAYQFNSTNFFPVDGLGWNAIGTPQLGTNAGTEGGRRNFSFTSELHYQFTFRGGEVLDFTGDDDVWVFINNTLAVDLGGLHPALSKSITLTPTEATRLGLVAGNMYEIALFQAERHTDRSNYRLTLTGFVRLVTECQSICGDAIVTPDELCDDGLNDGRYGGCMPGCQEYGPTCGDGVVQSPPEACDDGVNLVTYGSAAQRCGPGCQWAPYCGDGVVSSGEACDEGTLNGTGGDHCRTSCKLGPHCGDGIVNGAEKCDDGPDNRPTAIAYGDGLCTAECQPAAYCGDSRTQAQFGEQCDGGDGCRANCTLVTVR